MKSIAKIASTKVSVIQDYQDTCSNQDIKFVPSHPIAGIEKSGPEYGFSKLFENRDFRKPVVNFIIKKH